jgi:membrane fusion protein, multidrug efflux system
MRTLIIALALAACSKADAPDKKGVKLQYPVDIATLEVRSMQYTVNAPGSLDAFQIVQITARVSGAVDKVAFSEGAEVAKDAVLASIDSERYEIAVEQAKSALNKANATQKSAETALERRLVAQKASPGLVPGEEIEQKQTAVETAKADVDAAKQALRVAQLNLRDSSVRTPIAGIVQTRTVQMGQYLAAGAVLATILQRDPLLLRFQVTEVDALRLSAPMKCTFSLRNYSHKATIKLVGGAADPATRLVPVTAEVDPIEKDNEKWLRPGAFVQVSIPVDAPRQGIVVPGLAIQPTDKGNVVFVVDDKSIVHATVVELGMHTPDGLVELTRGVKVGQEIVVRGIEPLSEGAPVKITSKITLEQASAVQDAGVPGVNSPPITPVGAGSDSGSGKAP